MMKLFIDFIQYIFFILSVDTVHLGAGLMSPSQFIQQLCQMTKKVELLDIHFFINIFKLIHLTSVPSVITGLGLKLPLLWFTFSKLNTILFERIRDRKRKRLQQDFTTDGDPVNCQALFLNTFKPKLLPDGFNHLLCQVSTF